MTAICGAITPAQPLFTQRCADLLLDSYMWRYNSSPATFHPEVNQICCITAICGAITQTQPLFTQRWADLLHDSYM
jgi:hypothetical protein